MANSYARLITHVTFSTRNRRPYLFRLDEDELYAYLGGTLNGFGGQTITVNGYRDHVHMLFHYPPRLAVAYLVQETKKASNKWVRERFGLPYFHWQVGFGAFSVYHREIDKAIRYIKNQKEHHRKKTFREEYLDLLREHEIEFDERYVVEPEDEGEEEV